VNSLDEKSPKAREVIVLLIFAEDNFLNALDVAFSLLPAPTQLVWDRDRELAKLKDPAASTSTALVSAASTAPPYGKRKGWLPR